MEVKISIRHRIRMCDMSAGQITINYGKEA